MRVIDRWALAIGMAVLFLAGYFYGSSADASCAALECDEVMFAVDSGTGGTGVNYDKLTCPFGGNTIYSVTPLKGNVEKYNVDTVTLEPSCKTLAPTECTNPPAGICKATKKSTACGTKVAGKARYFCATGGYGVQGSYNYNKDADGNVK